MIILPLHLSKSLGSVLQIYLLYNLLFLLTLSYALEEKYFKYSCRCTQETLTFNTQKAKNTKVYDPLIYTTFGL